MGGPSLVPPALDPSGQDSRQNIGFGPWIVLAGGYYTWGISCLALRSREPSSNCDLITSFYLAVKS